MTVPAGVEPARPPGLRIRDLTKAYKGDVLANDAVSLAIGPGEVFGLLGPNGAGKTTLVKQIIGLLKPAAGSIELDGIDLIENPSAARQLCAYLPQGHLPTDSLEVLEALELAGRLRGGGKAAVRRRARELIEALEMEEWADTLGMKLSGGARRLLGFGMATVWPSRLVILDEPTNDVDPLRRRLLWRQIRRLGAQGVTVLLVTHNVLEAEHSVDRLAILDRGRVLAQGTPSSLKADARHQLRLQLNLVPGAEPPQLPAFVTEHVLLSRRLRVVLDESEATEALDWGRALLERGIAEEYALAAATLEDTYLRLIGRDDALEE